MVAARSLVADLSDVGFVVGLCWFVDPEPVTVVAAVVALGAPRSGYRWYHSAEPDLNLHPAYIAAEPAGAAGLVLAGPVVPHSGRCEHYFVGPVTYLQPAVAVAETAVVPRLDRRPRTADHTLA